MKISAYFRSSARPPTRPLGVTRQTLVLDGEALDSANGPKTCLDTMQRWGFKDLGLAPTTAEGARCWLHPRGLVVMGDVASTDWQHRLVVLATLDMGHYSNDKDMLGNHVSLVSNETIGATLYHDLDGSIYQQVALGCTPNRLKQAVADLQRLGKLSGFSDMVRLGKAGNWPGKTHAFERAAVEKWDLDRADFSGMDKAMEGLVRWVADKAPQSAQYQDRVRAADSLIALVHRIAKQQERRYGKGDEYERLKRWCMQAANPRDEVHEVDHTVLASGLTQAVCLAALPGAENDALLEKWVKTAPLETLLKAVEGVDALVPPLVPLVVNRWGSFIQWQMANQLSPYTFASNKAVVVAVIDRVGAETVRNTWGDVWGSVETDQNLPSLPGLYEEYGRALVWAAQQMQWPLPDDRALALLGQQCDEKTMAPIRAWVREHRLEEAWSPAKASPRRRL